MDLHTPAPAPAPRVPGLTHTFGDAAEVAPFVKRLSDLKPTTDRGIILLSTGTITSQNIFMNGLSQNVFVFYRMFEAMGYAPIFLINERPKSLKEVPEILRTCRMIVTEDLLRQPMANMVAVLEIGMSMDPLVRQFVKMIGGKLLKVYLGNILNIDIETPLFTPAHNFAHHVVGKNDAILVSPHYGQHAEYASLLNHVVPPKDMNAMIAPYVWDPNIVTNDGRTLQRWVAPADPRDQVFIIMEPNISFQKTSVVPILILERWYRDVGRAAGWRGKVIVINGERFEMVPHFMENVAPQLDLHRAGLIEYNARLDIVSALREWPSAAFVLHNFNNEYNYMTMELLWCGFPVLHNSPTWSSYGYSYEDADLCEAAKQIEALRCHHAERMETYKAHAAALAWRHSPYNPDIQAAWEKLIRN